MPADAEFVVRMDGALVHADDGALELYGYTREEMLGLHIRQLRAPDVQEDLRARMEEALAGQVRFETRHRRKDGTLLEVEVTAKGFTMADVGYIRSRVRDLTAVRRLEQELTAVRRLEQEQRVLAGLLPRMAEGILVTDPELRITEYTGHAQQLYGLTRAEALGRSLRLDFTYEFPDGDREAFVAHLVAGEETRTSMRVLRPDGAWAELDLMVTPLRNDAGALTGWLSVARDRGPGLVAARAREESERRLHALYLALTEGVVLLDADGKVLDCNPAAERLLGLTLAQLQGRAPTDPAWQTVDEQGNLLPPEGWPSSETLRTGEPIRGRVLGGRRPGQEPLWLAANSEPVRMAPGERPHGVVSTFSLLRP
jgi:PAS domain S-box-containing protein